MFTPDFSNTAPAKIQNGVHNNWNQEPPEYMPWGLLSQPRVTRFCGEPNQPTFSSQEQSLWSNNQLDLWGKSVTGLCTTKRKLEDPIEEQSRKQLITEDKITVHMSQLNIGEGIEAAQLRLAAQDETNSSTAYLDGIKIDEGSTLVLSEEIRRFQNESSIPPSLLESFMKPSMAVVLWQPRNTVDHLLRELSAPSGESNQPAVEETENNPPENDVELVEDDSNNNEPISNFNLNEPNHPVDLEMDDDL